MGVWDVVMGKPSMFCFRIEEKEKECCFFFSLLELNNYNGYVCAIFNCCFL